MPVGLFAPGVGVGLVEKNGHTPEVKNESLKINFTPDTGILDYFKKEAKIIVEDFRGYTQPILDHLINVENPDDDVHFAVGTLCHFTGNRLSFDPDDDHQDLFFLDESNVNNTYRIRFFSRIESRYLDFALKEVPADMYRLERRSLTKSGDMRIGVYGQTVEATAM